MRCVNSFAPFYFHGGGMRIRGRARLMRDRVISKRVVICLFPSLFLPHRREHLMCFPSHRDIPEAIERNKIMTKSHRAFFRSVRAANTGHDGRRVTYPV